MIIFTIIWKIWFFFVAFSGVLFLGPIVYIFTFKESQIKIAYKVIRIWAKLVFILTGFSYDLKLNYKLDKHQQYIFIANHTSMIDIIVFFLIHKSHLITFVGKKEIKKIPIIGQIYKRICILVDRKSIRSRAKVYELTKQKIKQKRSIVIFPEGGVPDDVNIVLDKFKDGAFSLALSENIPIVLYSIKGLKEAFPFDFFKGYPKKIKIELIEILNPNTEKFPNKEILKNYSFNKIHQNLTK